MRERNRGNSGSRRVPGPIRAALGVAAFGAVMAAGPAAAQDHAHALHVNGVPNGLPVFCASPTAVAVRDGAWSDAQTWSTGRVPGGGDKIAIAAGRSVVYDVVSDAALPCVEIKGRLAFKPDVNTRMKVVNLTVMDGGTLEVGTAAQPIGERAFAEIVVADRPFDPAIDPAQVGNGIEALGTVTMHGAAKQPTFVRLGEDALAGQTTITLEQPATGWTRGDRIVVPDTRQLRAASASPASDRRTRR